MAHARRPLIAGNWKMHKTVAQTRAFIAELLAATLPQEVDVIVAPPFTALEAARDTLGESSVALGAQTMHEGAQGPFTGEISPVMLLELGVTYVILGHSERRLQFGESDASINNKVRSAIAHGITPIVAVGETEAEHAAGVVRARVVSQTAAAFAGVDAADTARCVVAYEPIWAIGTGLVDSPAGANAVIGEIRACVAGLENARLLYGGSMKGENAAALMAQPNIDGGLVGGASLTVASFLAIVEAARARANA
jgi:triosephosphate isomerase